MRYAIATMLLAGAMACGGCGKPKGPKTTAIEPPVRTAGPLQPLEPPAGPEVTTGAPAVVTTAVEPMPPKPRPKTPPRPPSPPVAAAAPGGEYVVQPGETLWKIAARVYGNGQRYRDILAANPGLQPEKLKVGQKLVLPK